MINFESFKKHCRCFSFSFLVDMSNVKNQCPCVTKSRTAITRTYTCVHTYTQIHTHTYIHIHACTYTHRLLVRIQDLPPTDSLSMVIIVVGKQLFTVWFNVVVYSTGVPGRSGSTGYNPSSSPHAARPQLDQPCKLLAVSYHITLAVFARNTFQTYTVANC